MIPVLWLALLGAAPDAVQCREHYEALQFREAVASCEQALGDAPLQQRGDLYRMLAVSLGTVGDEAGARSAFESLLSLEPDFVLAPTVSPRFRELLQAARLASQATTVVVLVHPQQPVYRDSPLRLDIELGDGPARPVQQLRIHAGDLQQRLARRGDKLDVRVGSRWAPGPLDLRVDALDRFGGTLASARTQLTVLERYPARSFWLSWKAWGGSAVLLGGAGLGLGLWSRASLQHAHDDLYADHASADLGRARAEATGANVAYGAAAALAVGSLILLVTEHRTSP